MWIYKFIVSLLKKMRFTKCNENFPNITFDDVKNILNQIPTPVFYKDDKGIYRYCNNEFCKYLGLEKEKIVNKTVYDVSPIDCAVMYEKADNELIKKKGRQIYESKIKYSDGSLHDVIFSKAFISYGKNDIKGILGVITDITSQKRNEERINRLLKIKESIVELNQSIINMNNIQDLFNLILEKTIKSIKDAAVGAILILDENDNLKIEAYQGYDYENVKNFSLKLEESFSYIETNGKIDRTIVVNGIDKKEHFKLLNTNDNKIIKSTISCPIFIENKLYGFVNVDSKYENVFDEMDLEIMEYMRNQIQIAITNHKLYEKTIYLSRYDNLTNTYNRRYFEELFKTYSEKAIVHNKSFFIVVFDLDGLKNVNDVFGHLAGDELIKTFAKELKERIRSSDILARYGGDEFVAIFFNIRYEDLVKKLENLIGNFRNNNIIFDNNEIICRFSYGICEFLKDGKTYKELIKLADERMYEYKHKKR